MQEKIAVLTSTSPLRMLEQHAGRDRQTIDPKACMELAQRFTLIIIGSRSSDKVFDRIARSISAGARLKFRFYSRTFFDQYETPAEGELTQSAMNKAWLEILKMNRIIFDLQAKIIGGDYSVKYEDFDWTRLSAFIADRRVTFIGTRDDVFRTSADNLA